MRFLSFTVLLIACGGSGSGTDAGPPQGPHAMGAITVIEAHATGSGGNATSTVAAGFIPDAATMAPTCTKTVAGCEVALAPDCNNTCGDQAVLRVRHELHRDVQADLRLDVRRRRRVLLPDADDVGMSPAPELRRRNAHALGHDHAGDVVPAVFVQGHRLAARCSTMAPRSRLSRRARLPPAIKIFSESFTATHLFRTEPGLDKLGITDVFGTGEHPDPLDRRPGRPSSSRRRSSQRAARSGRSRARPTTRPASSTSRAMRSRRSLAASNPLDKLTLAVTRTRCSRPTISPRWAWSGRRCPAGRLARPGDELDGDAPRSRAATARAGMWQRVRRHLTNAHCGSCDHACASGDTCDDRHVRGCDRVSDSASRRVDRDGRLRVRRVCRVRPNADCAAEELHRSRAPTARASRLVSTRT